MADARGAANVALAVALSGAILVTSVGCGSARPQVKDKPTPTTVPGPRHGAYRPRLYIAVLFVLKRGDRADRLLACLRQRVAPFHFVVRVRHGAVLVAGQDSPGPGRVRQLVRQQLAACDRGWRA